MESYSLLYLAPSSYGGWVTFTAHLALKHNFKVYKAHARTEKLKSGDPRLRDFGYGVKYQNISKDDIKELKNVIIVASHKSYYEYFQSVHDDAHIVIHDYTETKSRLLEFVNRFRILTIRMSVHDWLLTKHNIVSKFITHPFHPYPILKSIKPHKCVSISRIDFDKHVDLLLKANKTIESPIELYGFQNKRYVYFKLKDLDFSKHYKGQFKKSFQTLSAILSDAKFVIDMSAIVYDGGGTQYTFLEAIHNDCALILNKKWITDDSLFIDGYNCYVADNEHDIAKILNKPTEDIISNSKALLQKCIDVSWIDELKYKH